MSNTTVILDALEPLFVDKNAASKYWKGVLFGWPGVGKTVEACSVGESVLHVAADPEGYDSLENHPEIWKRVQPMDYKGLTQIDALVKSISDGPLQGRFDHFVIDTYSSAVDLDLQRIFGRRMDREKVKPEDRMSPGWEDFYPSQVRAEERLQKLFLLPMHVTLVAHVTEIKVGNRVDKIRPSFHPKMWNIVNKWTKNCYWIEKEVDAQGKVTRILQTDGDDVIEGKTRIGGLPLRVKIPHNQPQLGIIVKNWQERVIANAEVSE